MGTSSSRPARKKRQDYLEEWSYDWDRCGVGLRLTGAFFFMSALAMLIVGAIRFRGPEEDFPFLAIAGAALAMGVFMYAGHMVTSLASAVLKRITALEAAVEELRKARGGSAEP